MTTLYLDASARYYDPKARRLAMDILSQIGDPVIYRPANETLMFHADLWADAHFTSVHSRLSPHREALEISQDLLTELLVAKTLVIGTAVYNHSVPTVLKAWLKLITLNEAVYDAPDMHDKKAVLVMARGGKKFGTQFDHAVPYLQNMFEMIGFSQIEFVAADQPADATHIPMRGPISHARPMMRAA